MSWYEWCGPNDLDEPRAVLSGGPDRIYEDDPKPGSPPRPAGFLAKVGHIWITEDDTEVEPLLWEGDQA